MESLLWLSVLHLEHPFPSLPRAPSLYPGSSQAVPHSRSVLSPALSLFHHYYLLFTNIIDIYYLEI